MHRCSVNRRRSRSTLIHPFLFLLLSILVLSFVTRAYGGRDFYDVLGVPREADSATIKRAFRKLAIKYHPDKNPGNKKAEEKYVELNNAYEVLTDDTKRRRYNMYGEDGMNHHDQDMDEDHPFSHHFGGHQHGRAQEPNRVEDVVIPITVSLESLYNGDVVEIAHKKRVICDSWSDCEKPCSNCRGRGVIIQTRRLGPGFIQQVQTACPVCGGTGKIGTPNCTSCPNGQFEQTQKLLLVDIEKGMKDGQHITFEGETDEVPEHHPGNINFEIDTAKHDRFNRVGSDLHYRLPITLSEALVSVNREVRHLDGRLVPIKTEKIIIPGEQIVIEGEGMPNHGEGETGDMIVEFWVSFPQVLTEEQKKAVLELHGQLPSLKDTGDGTIKPEHVLNKGGSDKDEL